MGNLVTSQEKQGESENVKPKSEKSYPFQAMYHFYTPWKHQKAVGFLMFPGV